MPGVRRLSLVLSIGVAMLITPADAAEQTTYPLALKVLEAQWVSAGSVSDTNCSFYGSSMRCSSSTSSVSSAVILAEAEGKQYILACNPSRVAYGLGKIFHKCSLLSPGDYRARWVKKGLAVEGYIRPKQKRTEITYYILKVKSQP